MFNESNTVEQMIIDTVVVPTGAGYGGMRDAPLTGRESSLGAPLEPTRWEYVPAAQVPRHTGDVMVEAWVREALIRLNPEIAEQPDRADEVIYMLRACILSVKADGLVRANETFTAWLRGEKTMPFGPGGEHVPVRLAGAQLNYANLTRARLERANLTKAFLPFANLTDANLEDANLTEAILVRANLIRATLLKANLAGSRLDGVDLSEARMNEVNLTNATYTPILQPSISYIANIQGLKNVVFPKGEETGLVQLRELLQKAGLRDLEREATSAIERGKTWYMLKLPGQWAEAHKYNYKAEKIQNELYNIEGFDLWKLFNIYYENVFVLEIIFDHYGELGEGIFRLIAFDWTTTYGLSPARALAIIFWIYAILIPVYAWAIFRMPYCFDSPGIYRVWSKERIEADAGKLRLSDATDIERLSERNWHAITWGAYFSLLSAFHIGFRDFNVGSWIARIQAGKYTLEPTGWVRVVSGLQSLLSVYLLAIWALTYFGRPFQ
jgi:hypothetical protein